MRIGMVLATCAMGLVPLLAPAGASAQAPAPGASPGAPTAAQDEQAMLRMMHRGARNQLGVLQYCQSNGSIGADVVVLQRQMLAMLPPIQVDGLDQAEAAGKRGVVQFGGQEMAIPDAAKARNTTPDALCKQIGAALQAQAAQMPHQAPR